MPSQVYEQSITLTSKGVETVPFQPENVEKCYPWTKLKLGKSVEEKEFPVVVLENSYLRLKILPTLGGRIIEFHDKRTGSNIFPDSKQLSLVEAGERGVECQSGMEFIFCGSSRGNSLGRVEYQLHEPDEESDPAAVFLHELESGSPYSWTACITLNPHAAEVIFDMRVVNRGIQNIDLRPGLRVWAPGEYQPVNGSNLGWYNQDQNKGFAFEVIDGRMAAEQTDASISLESLTGYLGPRKVEEVKVKLVCYSNLGKVKQITPVAGIGIDHELRVQVSQPIVGGKLFLKTDNQQVFESGADIDPGEMWVGNLSGLPGAVEGVVLRDFEKRELISFDESIVQIDLDQNYDLSVKSLKESLLEEFSELVHQGQTGNPEKFAKYWHAPGMESIGYWGSAVESISKEDWVKANKFLDRALTFSSEDALLWWLKAAIGRRSGGEMEERPELMNAHFLDPLEPVLRAEAFLSQPVSEFKEGNPITKQLAENPEEAIEVACLLLESGLVTDLARYGDEILRHSEIPGIRDILAYALLKYSRMDASAAEQVVLAGKTPLKPPFPWRRIQKRIYQKLNQDFPNDQRILTLLKLMNG